MLKKTLVFLEKYRRVSEICAIKSKSIKLYTVMLKKSLYKSPFAELVWAESEESFMSPDQFNQGGGGSYGDEETNENGDY